MRPTATTVALVCAVVAGLAVAAGPSTTQAPTGPLTFEAPGTEPARCNVLDWAAPAALATDHLTGDELDLTVHVLVDGARGLTRSNVEGLLTDAAIETYLEGINVNVSFTWGRVSMPGDTGTTEQAFDVAKSATGGRPPAGADLVYLITDQDMSGSVAGQADCIGGIMNPSEAYAVGEYDERDHEVDEGAAYSIFKNITGKVFAHEVGHLLGAHHHYANCTEGVPSDPVADALSVCTLMINDVGLASLNLSAVNSSVTRGHVREYGG